MAKVRGWDKIKAALEKGAKGKKTEDEEEPVDLDSSTTNEDDDDDDDEYEDAAPIIKALTEKIDALQTVIETMAHAQAATLERLEQSDSMQKSLGQGILAIMDRTEAVLASPAPRRAAVTQLEAALAKSLAGGGAAGGNGTGARLRPFTPETIDRTMDILTKAVSDGEIDVITCGKFETQMNKSLGKSSFPFTDEFVAFMQKKLSA